MGVPARASPGHHPSQLDGRRPTAIAPKAMGLGSRAEIVQVYLACDRNENQAANILMDNLSMIATAHRRVIPFSVQSKYVSRSECSSTFVICFHTRVFT